MTQAEREKLINDIEKSQKERKLKNLERIQQHMQSRDEMYQKFEKLKIDKG